MREKRVKKKKVEDLPRPETPGFPGELLPASSRLA
jgi:hypothetical protein